MSANSANSNRIAKNTLALYLRTIITMALGLYTSRVVLNALGIEDYGVYNIVGGVVSMFNIITTSLSQAISRYLTYELGKGNTQKLHVIFCTSVNVQIIMAILMILLMEVVGVWFLNNKINIAQERLVAANWVLQFSIMTFVVSLISVPYNAAIIAHENMSAFAYISIIEAALKLGVALSIMFSSTDRLISYAFLMLMTSVIIRIIYGIYCKNKFQECHYTLIFDKALLKDMTKFAGWNALPNGAYIVNTEGINILANLFFGVTVNAARGVVTQAESVVRGFVLNFTMAINPQIIKSYSSGDRAYMIKLICKGTKFSYFLMLVIAMPFMFEAENILYIWLKNYPPQAPIFIRWSMISTLMVLLGSLLYTNIMATGKIKQYMLSEAIITVFVFPLSWIFYKIGCPAHTPYILLTIAYFILVWLRLEYLHKEEDFPIHTFIKQVLIPVAIVTPISAILPFLVRFLFVTGDSFLSFLLNVTVDILSVCLCVYIFGLTHDERTLFAKKIRTFKK